MAVSNADILAEVKDIKREQKQHSNTIREHENRLRKLENFQIAYEAATKALADNSIKGRAGSINKDFANVVLKFIALLTALVSLFYLIIQALVNSH